MTEFSAYEFRVTGAPGTSANELRTLPERLDDVKNVRDFGATGDGVTDDWAAIQSATEWNSVALLCATNSPGIPFDAVRATLTVAFSAGVVTGLTIANGGNNYEPGRTYNVAFQKAIGSSGPSAAAVATVTANGSGVISSVSLTNGGAGYTVAPDARVEYPGHTVTLTFTSMIDLISLGYNYWAIDADHQNIIIELGPNLIVSGTVNIPAKTVMLRAHEDSEHILADNTAVVRPPGITGGVTRIKFGKPSAGTIFFPPGTYKVGSPIDLGRKNFNVCGVGRGSKIIGNFDNYIFHTGTASLLGRYTSSGLAYGPLTLENLLVENTHPTGGAIRWSTVFGGLKNVDVIANRGVSCYTQDFSAPAGVFAYPGEGAAPRGGFDGVIENCTFTCASGQRTGSFGLAYSGDKTVKNCSFYDLETGMMTCGGQGGIGVKGCRFELCTTGYLGNAMPEGPGYSIALVGILGCSFLNCGTAIDNLVQGSGYCCGVVIHADPGGAPGGIDAAYGIKIMGSVQRSLYGGVLITGTYSVAGVSVQIDSFRADRALAGIVSSSWTTTMSGSSYSLFAECNKAPVGTFANLPPAGSTNRREGDEYNISNCTTNTFGATAAAGGSTHAKVRWDGTVWKVIGK